MSEFLLDDVFKVNVVDPDGKKFDLVSRIDGESENYGMRLLLDVNMELYPLKAGERITLVLAKSIALDANGAPMEAEAAWRADAGPTLADKYEYVMYGRTFKFEELSPTRMALYVSYGGLLMRLEADPRHFSNIAIGSSLYLLIRKL